MEQQNFKVIFEEYSDGYEIGNAYDIFEKHKNWFHINKDNGVLKSVLLEYIKDCLQEKNLKKYDFTLLIIQAFAIDFERTDEHFYFLFLMAALITKDFIFSENGDKRAWLLHQLTDICLHYSDEVDIVVKRKPELVASVVAKIGNIGYNHVNYTSQMYLATHKAIDLICYLDRIVAKKILNTVFLQHFDARIVDEAQELEKEFR